LAVTSLQCTIPLPFFTKEFLPKTTYLLSYSNNILNRWKNYFFSVTDVHNVSDIRQIEVHTAEPLVPGPNHIEVQIAIA
jgi:hypothetical protein